MNSNRLTRFLGSVAVCATLISSALANPTGPSVGYGSVTISGGQDMRIWQGTDRAIVNWQSFSIGSGERVHIEQPSTHAVILNRVWGPSGSEILGTLQANGNVFLVNPNGIFVGSGANISVGSLVTSTLPISDEAFLRGSSPRSKSSTGGPALRTLSHSGSGGTRQMVDFDGRQLIYFTLPSGTTGGDLLLAPGVGSGILAQTLGASPTLQANNMVQSSDGGLRLVRAQTTGEPVTTPITNPTTVTVTVTLVPLQPEFVHESVVDASAFAQDNALMVETELLDLDQFSDILEENDDPTARALNWWDSEDFMRHKNR